jgi:hypothetical protein
MNGRRHTAILDDLGGGLPVNHYDSGGLESEGGLRTTGRSEGKLKKAVILISDLVRDLFWDMKSHGLPTSF